MLDAEGTALGRWFTVPTFLRFGTTRFEKKSLVNVIAYYSPKESSGS